MHETSLFDKTLLDRWRVKPPKVDGTEGNRSQMNADLDTIQVSFDNFFIEKCSDLANDAENIQIFSEEVEIENLKEEKQNGPQKQQS